MHEPTLVQAHGWWTLAGGWPGTVWDALVLGGLLAVAGLYGVGVARLWRRAGLGRGVRWWEVTAFGLGWLTLLVALTPPLDALADVLFAAHMVQHELLMLVAAPLVVLGRPLVVLVWVAPGRLGAGAQALQRTSLFTLWRGMTAPVTVLLLHGAALWIWHAPGLFEAALHHDGVHALQHLSFFSTAALFWWALVHGRYGRLGYGIATMFVFLTAMHSMLLGVLLTFAPSVWYPTYERTVTALAGDPLRDQQLAGLLMWVPSKLLLAALALALFAAWLGELERRYPSAARDRSLTEGRPSA